MLENESVQNLSENKGKCSLLLFPTTYCVTNLLLFVDATGVSHVM